MLFGTHHFSIWNALVHLPSIHPVKTAHTLIPLEASVIPTSAQPLSPGYTCYQGSASSIAYVSLHDRYLLPCLIPMHVLDTPGPSEPSTKPATTAEIQ